MNGRRAIAFLRSGAQHRDRDSRVAHAAGNAGEVGHGQPAGRRVVRAVGARGGGKVAQLGDAEVAFEPVANALGARRVEAVAAEFRRDLGRRAGAAGQGGDCAKCGDASHP
jgi:hypothetical protein